MRRNTRNFAPSTASNSRAHAGMARAGRTVGRLRRNPVLAWVVFGMFLTLVAMFIPSDLGDTSNIVKDFNTPGVVTRAIKFALLGLSGLIIVSRLRLSMSLLKSINGFFLLFLALIPLSVLWSIEPAATTARYVSLMAVVLVCFSAALVDWNRARLQQVLRPILTLFLFSSILIGVLAPDLVTEKGNDFSLKSSWHGLASQKNEFGQLATFGLILWVHAALTRESKKLYILFGICVSTACLLLSRSSTSLLAGVFAVVTLLLLQRPPPALRRYTPYLVGMFAVLVLTYSVAVLNLVPGLGLLIEPFAAISGKDMTFSNRATIWAIIKDHIQLSPLLGSGYGAYWTGPVPTSPSYVFLSRMWMYPTQSHNGFLEVTNDLGFVGLVLLVAYLITYIAQSVSLMKVDRAQAALFIAVIFQQVIINLSEACWITARSASSTIFILFTAFLGRAILEAKRARAASSGTRRLRSE